MKRSNFTFLFLFALLSFVSTKIEAQNSCVPLNATVSGDCMVKIAGSQLPPGTDSLFLFGGSLGATGSGIAYAPGMAFPVVGLAGGTYSYKAIGDDASTGEDEVDLCWNTINLEFKAIPPVVDTLIEVCCLEEDDLSPYWPMRADAAGCYEEPASKTTSIVKSSIDGGDNCDTTVYVRTISGKFTTGISDLSVDTIKVIPVDLEEVCAPTEEVMLSCELIAGVDLTDEDAVKAAVHPSLLSAAYSLTDEGKDVKGTNWVDTLFFPYLKKDSIEMKVPTVDSMWLPVDTVETMVKVPDSNNPGDSLWILTSVVVKDSVAVPGDTLTMMVGKFTPVPKGTTCNINAKCTDMVLEGPCGGLPMVMRTWNLINWCDKSTETFQQWIIFEDDQKPKDLKISGDTDLSIAPWTCAATAQLTASASDWGDITYTWTSTAGTIKADGASVSISELWCAESPITVTVRATDGCDNYSEKTITLTVVDKVKPVAIAEDQVNVTLIPDGDGGGVAKVTADAINAGSHDAGCGEVQTCVLLKAEFLNPILDAAGNPVNDADGNHTYHAVQCAIDGTHPAVAASKGVAAVAAIPYVICKDYVKFCCTDQGDNEVALVVTDAGSECLSGHPNVSYSWSIVTVEDKSQGAINPGMIMADCDVPTAAALLAAISSTSAICTPSSTLTPGNPVGPDGCGYGEEVVNIYDADGAVVTTVTVKYKGAEDAEKFDPTTIKWPKHQTGKSVPGVRRECENDKIAEYDGDVAMGEALECTGLVVGAPVWCAPTCALVGANYEDDFDNSDSESCKTIIRRHTIIDWCVWTPNGDNTDDENDTDADEFEAVDDEWLPSSVIANAEVGDDCEDCEKTSGTADDVYFRYTKVDVDGYYTFDQVIKVIDETAPEISVMDTVYVDITGGNDVKDGTEVCTGSMSIPATASDLCGEDMSDSNITWWITRDGVDATDKADYGTDVVMSTGEGTAGEESSITWIARDNCGNTSTRTTIVIFRDNKAPTPVCLQDISTATMNVSGSSVAIWASDYDLGSFDNCDDDVHTYFKDSLGREVQSLAFSCDDIANGVSATIELAMYVSDDYGNEDFCYVTLRVDDNADICPDVNNGQSALISGIVRTELGDMIESAKVSLNKANVDFTSVEGKYAFGNTPMYNAYEITSNKDDDYMNGVSTLDLVLIQKHVLGIEALNSPFKVIAADINSDTRISAADLVELRKLILGVYTELPTNDSWRFVDAGETFADANDPFPFTEALNVTLDGPATDQDFVGVKIGDVSGNAIANSLIAAGTRSVGTLELAIADAELINGNEVSVAVSAKNFANISAYQFTMDVRGLEFTGVESGAINVTADNFAQLDANTITTAWYNASAITADEVLFTMTFKATANVQLSDALAINSRVTKAAAYTGDLEKLDVDVAFNGVANAEFALFQNEPNPFDNGTTISFQLAEAGAATLTVFDVTGKTVSVLRGDYAKGLNSISVTKADLNATGVLYYQLESGANTATKKMIVIE